MENKKIEVMLVEKRIVEKWDYTPSKGKFLVGVTDCCDFVFDEVGSYIIDRPKLDDERLYENEEFSLKLFSKIHFSVLKRLKKYVLPINPTNCIVRVGLYEINWFNLENLRHREDGPAVVFPQDMNPGGLQIWYKNGLIHREDGPALTSGGGHSVYASTGEIADVYSSKEVWYLNGKIHREDGPAVIEGKNSWKKEWWMDGFKVKEEIQYKNQPLIVNNF